MRIVFSPHIDDSFLSLGGSILNCLDNGEKVRIFDVFSLSSYTNTGAGDQTEVTRRRKREELGIGKLTGVEVAFFDFPEAPLRGYKMRKGRFIHPDKIDEKIDKGMLAKITKVALKHIGKGKNINCYFPLGTGNHVDHVLVRKLGEKLLRDGLIENAAFYKDIPYVGWFKLPETFIRKLKLKPYIETINIRKKINMVNKYKSQIEKDYIKILKAHAVSVGNNGGAERIWVKGRL